MVVSGPVTNQTASLSGPDGADLVTNEGWSDPILGANQRDFEFWEAGCAPTEDPCLAPRTPLF